MHNSILNLHVFVLLLQTFIYIFFIFKYKHRLNINDKEMWRTVVQDYILAFQPVEYI